MPHRLPAALVAVLLVAGCGSSKPPPVQTKVVIENCPPRVIEGSCPDFPERGGTLRELLLSWEAARSSYVECRTWAETQNEIIRSCVAGDGE